MKMKSATMATYRDNIERCVSSNKTLWILRDVHPPNGLTMFGADAVQSSSSASRPKSSSHSPFVNCPGHFSIRVTSLRVILHSLSGKKVRMRERAKAKNTKKKRTIHNKGGKCFELNQYHTQWELLCNCKRASTDWYILIEIVASCLAHGWKAISFRIRSAQREMISANCCIHSTETSIGGRLVAISTNNLYTGRNEQRDNSSVRTPSNAHFSVYLIASFVIVCLCIEAALRLTNFSVNHYIKIIIDKHVHLRDDNATLLCS